MGGPFISFLCTVVRIYRFQNSHSHVGMYVRIIIHLGRMSFKRVSGTFKVKSNICMTWFWHVLMSRTVNISYFLWNYLAKSHSNIHIKIFQYLFKKISQRREKVRSIANSVFTIEDKQSFKLWKVKHFTYFFA